LLISVAFCPIISKINLVFSSFKTYPGSVREILNCCSKFNKQKKAIRSGLPNKEKRELKRSTISHGNANLRGVNKMSPTDLMNSRPINKSDQVFIVMYSNYFLELSVPV
jgi:hypothetical protein